jgi:hypothetical protein
LAGTCGGLSTGRRSFTKGEAARHQEAVGIVRLDLGDQAAGARGATAEL